MKAVCSRIVAFLMIGVVLTLNTGMGLVEHTCFVSGKKSISTDQHQGCCAKKSKAPVSKPQVTVQKDKCCELNTAYLHIDFVSLSDSVSKFFSHLYFTIADSVVHVFNALVQKSETACSYTNSSPPESGRSLLLKHCTLRV